MIGLGARHFAIETLTPAVIVLFLPYMADAQGLKLPGDVFGQCAHPSSPEIKIAACTKASKATSFPWILHWVYRELARAQRDRGERDQAIVSYARSLAAREDSAVREEMQSLEPLTH